MRGSVCQLGPFVCPPVCGGMRDRRKDERGFHRRHRARAEIVPAQQSIHRARGDSARNVPGTSTHPPSTSCEPPPMKSGLGAASAISSCASTGRSFAVSGPAYLR